MKKILNFTLILLSLFSYSQTVKLPIGEYKTNKSVSEKANIILLDNNRFSVSSFFGTYEMKNDSIYFKPEEYDLPIFKVKFETSKTTPDKLNLTFDSKFIYYADDKFIGIQETEQSEIQYNKIQEFVNYGEIELDNYEKSINHCFAIYLVQENKNSKSNIEKFIIPENVSNIKIYQNEIKYNTSSQLQGFYDQKTKTLSVGANGKNFLNFSFDNNEIQKPEYVIPTDKTEIANWTYEGKIEKPSDLLDNAIDAAYATDSVVKNEYVFKLKIEKSLKDAFEVNKNNKVKSKFLMVINDPKDAKVKKEFNDNINSLQVELGYNMYDKYNPEYDNFDFYLTNAKDKSDSKKFGINESPSVSYYNSDGLKLYYYKGKIEENAFANYTLDAIKIELKKLDDNAKIDYVFNNKKSTTQQTVDVLYEITNQEVPYSDNVIDANFLPPVVVTEEVREDAKEEVKDEIKQDPEGAPVAEAMVAAPEEDNSILKIKENKYKLKTTEKDLADKYFKLLTAAQQDKLPNKKLVFVVLKELNNKGFTRILFNRNATINSKIHQLQMDYILKNYDSISKFNEIKDGETNEFEKEYYTTYDLQSQIMQLLKASVVKENCKQRDDLKNAMARYKKFVELSKNEETVLTNYMNALRENNYQNEYLTLFDDRFKSVVKDNSSVIEQLDTQFSIKSKDYYSENWAGFKYNFAQEANTAAWFVVEKIKDLSLIKKAIVWSETSVIIEKENNYYFDTLAQLYYKNGEKEKAIETEQKAIDFALKDNDEKQVDEYKIVLEKMKRGSY